MPEDERSGIYDPDEEYPWDTDLPYSLDEELSNDED